MINHGLSTAGLFAVVGMIYERYHTRQISELGGLAKRTPLLATFMLMFTMSSIGLPGLNGFVGEFMILLGMFQRAWTDAPGRWGLRLMVIAVLAVSGVVLGAWYMLWMVQRVFFGPLKEGHLSPDAGQQSSRPVESRSAGPLAAGGVYRVDRAISQAVFTADCPGVDRITERTNGPLASFYAAQPPTDVATPVAILAAPAANRQTVATKPILNDE